VEVGDDIKDGPTPPSDCVLGRDIEERAPKPDPTEVGGDEHSGNHPDALEGDAQCFRRHGEDGVNSAPDVKSDMTDDFAVAFSNPGGILVGRGDETAEVGRLVAGVAVEVMDQLRQCHAGFEVIFRSRADCHRGMLAQGALLAGEANVCGSCGGRASWPKGVQPLT
jgi:hypothetical protein